MGNIWEKAIANIWEKVISILAGNLNSGRSYLITAVYLMYAVYILYVIIENKQNHHDLYLLHHWSMCICQVISHFDWRWRLHPKILSTAVLSRIFDCFIWFCSFVKSFLDMLALKTEESLLNWAPFSAFSHITFTKRRQLWLL